MQKLHLGLAGSFVMGTLDDQDVPLMRLFEIQIKDEE